jgi:hypothetical protein
MLCRARILGLTLLAACAPSVPRPADKPHPPDAAADLQGAPDVAAPEARGESRPPPPESPTDAQGQADASSDSKSPAPVDARTDAAAGETNADTRGDEGGAILRLDAGPTVEAGSDSALSDGPPAVSPRPGEIVIDELLVNPASTDTNREWIEIANTTGLALDVRTLHVADAANEVAVDAGVMAPGAILVLGQSIDPAKNGGAPVALAYGSTISLNNDGDAISICLGPCAGGVILSRVSWTGDLGASYDGHAVMVAPDTGAFCPASDPFGTAGSFGTPGAANPPCPP